jgi:hypothetical protein
MLIQDFIQIAKPFDEAQALILRGPHALLDSSIAAGYHDAEQLGLRLAPSGKHPGIGKRIWVDIGEPYARGEGLFIPVHWWAKGATFLFPRLDGDLEVMPLGSDTTQITLMGRYEAPPGSDGKKLNRMLLHQLAEASVRSFLNQLGELLQHAGPIGLAV